MKKTIEIIQEIERLKKLEVDTENPQSLLDDFDYLASQFKILDYILMDKSLPEEVEQQLKEMYKVALAECMTITDVKTCSSDEKKKLGAADILAWVLNVSKKAHKKNRKKGTATNL